MRSKSSLMKSAGLALFAVFILFAEVPRQIAYRGILTDPKGNPKPDGAYAVTFSLYSEATSGAAQWSQSENITTHNGTFATMLGSVNPLNLPFNRQYWLGVTVAGKELPPRIPLAATSYSLRADTADIAKTAVNATRATFADTATYARGAVIAAASIDSTKIMAGGIAGSNLAAGSVDSSMIKSGSIKRGNVTALFKAPYADTADVAKSVSGAGIGDNSIDGAKIVDSTITGADVSKGANLNVATVVTSGNVGVGTTNPRDASLIVQNEIGPVTGAAPYLQLNPDSLFDFRDLFVYMRMWYWQAAGSAAAKVYGPLAKTLSTDALQIMSNDPGPRMGRSASIPQSRVQQNSLHHIDARTSARDLRIDLSVDKVHELVACRYVIWCGPNDLSLDSIANNDLFNRNDGNAMVLNQTNPGSITIDMARLSASTPAVSGSGRIASLFLQKPSGDLSAIAVEYELVGAEHQIIESGVVSLDSLSEDGKGTTGITAMQIGPNPATIAPSTGRFEIKNVLLNKVIDDNTPGVFFWLDISRPQIGAPTTRLMVAIRIYDIVGNLVAESECRDIMPDLLASQGNSPYVIFWDGYNRNGVAVSPGVYQAALKWSANSNARILTGKIGISR
jgi:hypothetical protein